MNLLSKDMQKPHPVIVTLDVQDVLDKDDAELLLTEEDNIEFTAVLANIVDLENIPKRDNVVNESVKVNPQVGGRNVVVHTDKFPTILSLTEQHDGNPQDWLVEVKIDGKSAPEVQLLSSQAQRNYSSVKQTANRDEGNLIRSASNIPLQTTNSDLIKNIPYGFGGTQILMPNKFASSIDDAVFVDIGSVQKQQPPNRSVIITTLSLIPTRDFTGANVHLPQIAPHDLLLTPLGEVNSLQQTQIPIQTPTPIPSLANSVLLQVREAILEHVGAVHDALRDQSNQKPKDIIVQLSPAELGRVQIRFSFDAGEHVVAQLVAENSETMAVLRQKSGLLLAQLKLGGFENINLNFETVGQKNLSGQNSGTEFFKGQNGQSEPNLWRTDKGDPKSDDQQLGEDDTNYKVRNHMHAQSSQIDIII